MKNKKFNDILQDKWSDIKDWFLDKDHPRSKLNKKVFFYDLLKFIGFLLIFLIIYSNIDKFNKIVILIILLGSTLLLVLLYFLVRKLIDLFSNLKYWWRGLNHGMKTIFYILGVLIILYAFLNQGLVSDSVVNTYDSIEFKNFIPITLEKINGSSDFLSLFKFGSVSCISDFNEDQRVAGEKDPNWRYKILEKESDLSKEDAIALVNKWDPGNKANAVKTINGWDEETIDLIIYSWRTRDCLFDACMDDNGISMAYCDEEDAKFPRGSSSFFGF